MTIERKFHIKYIKLEYRNVSNFNKVHIIIIYMDKNTIRLLSKTPINPILVHLYVFVCVYGCACACVSVFVCVDFFSSVEFYSKEIARLV